MGSKYILGVCASFTLLLRTEHKNNDNNCSLDSTVTSVKSSFTDLNALIYWFKVSKEAIANKNKQTNKQKNERERKPHAWL